MPMFAVQKTRIKGEAGKPENIRHFLPGIAKSEATKRS